MNLHASPSPSSSLDEPADARGRRWRAIAFWALLIALVSWDLLRSPAVDLRREPPLIAAGSGQAVSGGHCSMAK